MREFLRVLSVVSALLLMAAAAEAQDVRRSPAPIAGDGSELFRALLHLKGIKPVKEYELSDLSYNDVIVISLGRSLKSGLLPDVRTYSPILSGHGAILIASDEMADLSFASAKITGTHVECLDSKSDLKGLPDCPYVIPRRNIPRNEEVSKLFLGDGAEQKPLTKVAAGTPSYIDLDKNNSSYRLARFPGQCFWAVAGQPRQLSTDDAFAVGGELHPDHVRARFLAMASSRMFNNAMLADKETDNLEFTLRAIEFLQGPGQLRSRCLFIEDGKLVDHFDDLARIESLQNLPIPVPSPKVTKDLQKKIVSLADRMLEQLQKNDTINKMLSKINVWPYLLGLGAIAFSVLLLKRAIASRKPTNIPAAPAVVAASSGPPGVFERRQKELLRRNNIYEPVRDLVREFFTGLGIHAEPRMKHPKVIVTYGVRKPDSLKLAIQDFWKLAYGKPQNLSVQRWQIMGPYFERLQQAHADGKWRFVMPAATTTS